MQFSRRKLLSLLVLLAVVACGGLVYRNIHSPQAYVQSIHFPGAGLTVWDLVGVHAGGTALQPLRQGGAKAKTAEGNVELLFANGVKLESDGKRVRINGREIPEKTGNMIVGGANGYTLGAFVRTFE